MALYIPHSIFHLARLLYVRPETFGPYYVHLKLPNDFRQNFVQPEFAVNVKTTSLLLISISSAIVALCTARFKVQILYWLST